MINLQKLVSFVSSRYGRRKIWPKCLLFFCETNNWSISSSIEPSSYNYKDKIVFNLILSFSLRLITKQERRKENNIEMFSNIRMEEREDTKLSSSDGSSVSYSPFILLTDRPYHNMNAKLFILYPCSFSFKNN